MDKPVIDEQPDQEPFAEVARECVKLCAKDRGVELQWSIEGLSQLDRVLSEIVAEGVTADRCRLWTTLAGAFAGEVLIKLYEGKWIQYNGDPAVHLASGFTVFPHTTAFRILKGESYKSLATVARGIAAVEARDQSGGQ